MKVGAVFDVQQRLKRDQRTQEWSDMAHACNIAYTAVLGVYRLLLQRSGNWPSPRMCRQQPSRVLPLTGPNGFGMWWATISPTARRLSMLPFWMAPLILSGHKLLDERT
jgi:hypothetical protein